MHFLYSFCGIFLFFNTYLSVFSQCISSFPHTQDFQSSDGSWTPNAAGSWVWGNVTKPVINSSGSLCWTNNSLTTGYPANAQVHVTSPCYDFSSLTNPHLSCRVWWETERGWDGVNLQYSTNGGATWTRLGNFGDPVNCLNANWYNANSITWLDVPVANSSGWSGNITPITGSCTNGFGSGGWVLAQKCLPLALAGQPNVIFRFHLGAGSTCQDDGFAFDDFTIQESPIVPDFTYICIGANTLDFTGLANPCATAWSWNFGDPASGASNTSTLQNPSHIFTSGGTFTVTLTATNPCGRSAVIAQVIDVDNCTTLPVDLLGLKAQLAGTSVHLSWQKPSEINAVKHFYIQRSTDEVHFETIATTYSSETYYRDTPPQHSATIFYRLIKVDNDGTYQYSKAAQVRLSEKLPARVFPNPVHQGEPIRLEALAPESYVSVYDMQGRKCMEVISSQNYLEIPTHTFVKGLYWIRIQNGDTPQTLKIQVN